MIALTHGHGDHVGETVELAKQFEPEVVANVELKGWLGAQGARSKTRCPARTRAAQSRRPG